MRLGLLGLGEAGTAMATSLATVSGVAVTGWDARLDDPESMRPMEASFPGSLGLATSLQDLISGCDTVLCVVTPQAALAVGADAARWLGAAHTYIDANSISPVRVSEIAQAVMPTGARFVDAALMAAVPPHGHRVPMLVSGPAAADVARTLGVLGFRMEAMGDRPGMASAAKMMRSVIVKGIEALLLESLAAATRHGVADAVLASLDAAFPEGTWQERADYFASRTGRHAARRAAELAEAMDAVAAAGIAPLVTAGARDRLLRAAAALEAIPDEERPEDLHRLVGLLGREVAGAAG